MTEEKTKKKSKEPKPEKPDGKLQPRSIDIMVEFKSPLLGTAPGNPDLYSEFIGSKSADAEKLKNELSSLPAEDLEAKGRTVFHRDDNGNPVLLDYQVKGMIKEAFKVFCEFGEIKLAHGQKISKFTAQRIVDNFIYVYPRKIQLQLPEGTEITECVRPLKANTMKGERVSLACSEQIPRGTAFSATIEWLNPALEKPIRDALDYGIKKGIGQWRNSGMGRFEWKEAVSVKKDAAA